MEGEPGRRQGRAFLGAGGASEPGGGRGCGLAQVSAGGPPARRMVAGRVWQAGALGLHTRQAGSGVASCFRSFSAAPSEPGCAPWVPLAVPLPPGHGARRPASSLRATRRSVCPDSCPQPEASRSPSDLSGPSSFCLCPCGHSRPIWPSCGSRGLPGSPVAAVTHLPGGHGKTAHWNVASVKAKGVLRVKEIVHGCAQWPCS